MLLRLYCHISPQSTVRLREVALSGKRAKTAQVSSVICSAHCGFPCSAVCSTRPIDGVDHYSLRCVYLMQRSSRLRPGAYDASCAVLRRCCPAHSAWIMGGDGAEQLCVRFSCCVSSSFSAVVGDVARVVGFKEQTLCDYARCGRRREDSGSASSCASDRTVCVC